MNDDYEKLGMLIDDLESLYMALQLDMTAEFHVQQFKEILPKKIREFKEVFENITGENPWE